MPKKSNFNLNKLIIGTPMKIKMKILTDSEYGLRSIGALKLPLTSSYKISKAMKAVDAVLEPFYETRTKRIKELGKSQVNEKGEETGIFQVKPEHDEQYKKEIDELLDKEVTIDIPKIKLSDLGEEKVEPAALMSLHWMISE